MFEAGGDRLFVIHVWAYHPGVMRLAEIARNEELAVTWHLIAALGFFFFLVQGYRPSSIGSGVDMSSELAATVVLPTTGDRGPLLPYSVGSILSQTVRNIEVFIMGDGVTVRRVRQLPI